jgi:hypothetical protein
LDRPNCDAVILLTVSRLAEVVIPSAFTLVTSRSTAPSFGPLARAPELFLEAVSDESVSDGRRLHRQRRRQSHIGVEGQERREVDLLRGGMQVVQPVSPAANDDHPIQPGIERRNQAGEARDVGCERHHLFPFSSFPRARRAISSACALPQQPQFLASAVSPTFRWFCGFLALFG